MSAEIADYSVNEMMEDAFLDSFDWMTQEAYQCGVDHGWWETEDRLKEVLKDHPDLAKEAQDGLDGQKLALMTSEISEALDNIRHGRPTDDKIPEFTGEEAELADVIIRIMDYAGRKGLHLGEAILAKHKVNLSRPYKHGKKF